VKFVEMLAVGKIAQDELQSSYRSVCEQSKSFEHIAGDNVLEYIWDKWHPNKQGDLNQEGYLATADLDYPNLAPPFRNFLISFSKPLMLNSYESGSDVETYRACTWGVSFYSYGITSTLPDSTISILADNGESRASLRSKGAKWVLYAFPFCITRNSKAVVPPYFCNVFFLKDDGATLLKVFEYDTGAAERFTSHYGGTTEDTIRDWALMYEPFLAAALTTVTMMHCRNIEVVEKRDIRSIGKRPSLGRVAKSPSGGITFKTVVIPDTLKRTLETEGNISKTGIKQALHLCRGHFKDYRFGAGLYGKHKEIFWFSEHERGSVDYGKIIKDYQMKSGGFR
jgi:hypothetical protein